MKKSNRLQRGVSRLVAGAILLSSIPLGGMQGFASEQTGQKGPLNQFDWQDTMETYHVKWDSQSDNAGDSMPLGGGNIGLNVWAEDDEVLFYIGSNDSIDENLTIAKLGRVRLKMEPNPFSKGGSFSQKLDISKSNIEIKGQNADNSASLSLWVDVYNNTIHVDVETAQPTMVSAVYENWRTKDDTIVVPGYEMVYGDGQHYVYKDNFVPLENDGGLMFYHRNRDDAQVFDLMAEQQGLSGVKDQMYNPQYQYTFGGRIEGEGMKLLPGTVSGKYADTDFTGWVLQTEEPRTKTSLSVYTYMDNNDTIGDWITGLEKVREKAQNAQAREKTEKWWADFWNTSYVALNTSSADASDVVWQMGRNYALTRYMQGCSALAQYPIKFNGGMFIFDQAYVGTGPFFPEQMHGNPDFRFWGGGAATAQNQRIMYWPMLKNGDYSMMLPQFNFYNNALKNAELRAQTYWGHGGAVYDEWNSPTALSPYSVYGTERPLYLEDGIGQGDTKYQYLNQLEFGYMMLEYYRYSGLDISQYLPYIQSCVEFYYEHYQYRHKQETGQPFDEQGKLVISPSTATETFKNAVNPTDVICALNVIVDELLAMPDQYGGMVDQEYLKEIKSHLPQVKYAVANGKKIITIADKHDPQCNFELPELATVWPFGAIHIGSDELQTAINTWENISDPIGEPMGRRGNTDWQSGGVMAARMGLMDVATTFAAEKLADNDDGYRFPVFYGQVFDWTPNIESASSGMNMVQEILLQGYGKDVYLLPTTPDSWEVNAKLMVGLGTECTVSKESGGKITALKFRQLTSQRDEIVLHYPGIGIDGVKVTDRFGNIVNVTRGSDTIIIPVQQGGEYEVTGIPAAALTAPENLSAVRPAANSSTAQLSWDAVSGAASYNLYRLSTSDGLKKKIANATGTSFEDTSALTPAGETCLYAVSTVNADGYESTPTIMTPVKARAERLMLEYTFDLDHGAAITDTSGSGRDGVATIDSANNSADTGLTAGKGGEGQAYLFNNRSYIRTDSALKLDFTKNFSLQADIKPYNYTWYRRIFDMYNGSGFLLDRTETGGIRFFASNGADAMTSTVAVPLNEWSCVRMEYTAPNTDSPNGHVTVLLNGKSILDFNLNTALTDPGVPMTIGGDNGGTSGSSFCGEMDNIRFFDEGLSAGETEMLAGDLLLKYTFDSDTAGGVIQDSSSHKNDGEVKTDTANNTSHTGLVAGKDGIGQAYLFNNQTYIQTPRTLNLNVKKDFVLQADINPSGHDYWRRIFDMYDGAGNGFILDLTNEAKLRFLTNSGTNWFESSVLVQMDTWSTVRMEYAAPASVGGTGRILVKLDGKTVLDTALNTPIAVPGVPMSFGCEYSGNNQSTFQGTMDNIMVYGEGRYAAMPKPVSIEIDLDSSLEMGTKAVPSVYGVMPGGGRVQLDPLGVTYSVSDLNILDLSGSARVRGVLPGTASVAAALTWNGIAYHAEKTVSVLVPDTVESIFFGQGGLGLPTGGDNLYLKVFGTTRDGACVDLTRAAKITSSQNSVATVTQDGYIKAVASGDVTFTANIVSGERVLTAECKAHVEKETLFALDFKEITGDRTPDVSGNSHDGILKGNVVQTSTPTGKGVALQGGFVEIADSSAVDTSLGFTLEGSFYPTKYGDYVRLFDKKPEDTENRTGLMIDITPTGNIRIMHSNWFTTVNYRLPLNAWTNLRVVYDSVNSQLFLFANDSMVEKLDGVSISTANANMRIGADPLGGSQFLGMAGNISMSRASVTLLSFSANSIDLSGSGESITQPGETLQMNAVVSPAAANSRKLKWAVYAEDGASPTLAASISPDGLLRAHADGIVVVKAAALDGSGVSGTKTVTISGQKNLVKDLGVDLKSGWEVKGGGNWVIDNQTAAQLAQQPVGGSWNPSLQFTGQRFKDYSMQATFKINETNSESPGFIGFKMRSPDNSDTVMESGGFYICVEPRGRIFVYTNHHGEMSTQKVFIPEFDLSKEFTLYTQVVGNSVSVQINGTELLNYYNEKLTQGDGYISVFSGILPIQVRDVKVKYLEKLADPEEPDPGPVDPEEPDPGPVDPEEPDPGPVDPEEPNPGPVDPEEPNPGPVDPEEPGNPGTGDASSCVAAGMLLLSGAGIWVCLKRKKILKRAG